MNTQNNKEVNREIGSDLRVTRHGSTRHWAVWEGAELLTVTLHLKGARAIARRLAPHSTPPEQALIVAAIDTQGGHVRLMMSSNNKLTQVCYGLRGAFHSDYRCSASISTLLGQGCFTLRSATGARKLATYINKTERKYHA